MSTDLFWLIAGLVSLGVGILVYRNRKKPIPASLAPRGSTAMAQARVAKQTQAGGLILGLLLMVFGVTVVGMDSWTVIPAKNGGVVNVLGNANRSLSNGPALVEPWATVETVDATKQNFNYNPDMAQWSRTDAPVCTTVTVRLRNQTTACLELTMQWNINQQGNINELWKNYRGTNDNVVLNVGTNLVLRQLQRAANNAFETFDPLAVLNNDGTSSVTTTSLSKDIEADLKRSLGNEIVVDYMIISVVHYDAVTQSKLNAFAQQIADTQIATQAVITAKQRQLANDILAAASSSDPGVMYQNCLTLIADLAAKNQLQNLPQAFTCGGATPAALLIGQR